MNLAPDPWLVLWAASVLTGVALLVFGHVYATKTHFAGCFSALELLTEKPNPRADRTPDSRHFNEELLKARIEMVKNMVAVEIHLVFLICLSAAWSFAESPCLSTLCKFFAAVFSYALCCFGPKMLNTQTRFHQLEAIMVFVQALWVIGAAIETDLQTFEVADRVATASVLSSSLAMIDFKVFMPVYVCQSAVLMYCRLSFIGFAKMTPFMVLMPIVAYAVVGGGIALSVLNIQKNIATKLDSSEVTSLMLGFRRVLRGVCDGDLVLDRRTMTIVDDATCLERLLKSSKRLSNSNFLDAFLDGDSREKFSKFLADTETTQGMPRGLRVSLQGSRGPVSVDLFSTALRSGGSDYCLLAMKEDPLEQLQTAPPEALPNSAPERIRQPAELPERSSTSEQTERLVAYDDLTEVGLLVSDVTGLLDIEQVHLSFKRKSSVSNIESGMPTLRRIIRPSDWDRVERMFNIVTNLPPQDRHERCYFRRPTYFRVPGESRRYMCAKYTSLRLADESIQPGRPSRFWMHLGRFLSSQSLRSQRSQRSWEQQLENIEEER